MTIQEKRAILKNYRRESLYHRLVLWTYGLMVLAAYAFAIHSIVLGVSGGGSGDFIGAAGLTIVAGGLILIIACLLSVGWVAVYHFEKWPLKIFLLGTIVSGYLSVSTAYLYTFPQLQDFIVYGESFYRLVNHIIGLSGYALPLVAFLLNYYWFKRVIKAVNAGRI